MQRRVALGINKMFRLGIEPEIVDGTGRRLRHDRIVVEVQRRREELTTLRRFLPAPF